MNCGPVAVGLASPGSDDQKGAMVFVDPTLLNRGGNESQRAGDHVHQAAQQLSKTELLPQMFGDFAAAEIFHALTGSVQVMHTRLLLRHREFLGDMGDSALLAAVEFIDMDRDNAASVRAVWCNSAT